MPLKYIILDTNCFINALHKNDVGFNFNKIKRYAKENNVYITISAYSLYELVQNLYSLDTIDQFRKQLIEFGDFWVLGNNILEHKGIEYGLDFLFLLSMQNNDLAVEFGNKRTIFRENVYHVLFNKMFFYAMTVAALYVYITECDNKGNISYDTYVKIEYISNHYLNDHKNRHIIQFSQAYKHAGLRSYSLVSHEFYKDYNAKDELSSYMLDMIIQTLSAADVELSLVKKEWVFDSNEYYCKLYRKIKQLSSYINQNTFRKVNINAKMRTNKKVTIEKALDEYMTYCSDGLKKEGYHYMIEKLFNYGFFGAGFNNDFIDLSNLSLLDDFKPGEAVYLTTEKSWLKLLVKNRNNPKVTPTLQFIKEYGLEDIKLFYLYENNRNI